MKPRIEIIATAVPFRESAIQDTPSRRAIIAVDSVQFFSETPLSESEAIEINTAIERLQDLAK